MGKNTGEITNDLDVTENITVEDFSKVTGFKIMHLNARSLLPKLDNIRYSFTPHVNILCFTETWFRPELVPELLQIKRYQLIRNDRTQKRGGGTCIFLRDEIKYDVITQISDIHIELQALNIKGNNAKKIILLNCYRPPNGNPDIAVDTIKSCLNQIDNLDRCEIIILGDLNLDYIDTNSNSHRLLVSIEEEFNLKQIVQTCTRFHRSGSTLIDVILTNIKNTYMSGCINYNISDHLPIYIVKKRKHIVGEKKYVYCRSYRNYNKDIFQENLRKLDWSILDLLDNIEDMWCMIYKAIEYEVNCMCPYKRIKISINRPEWMNRELLEYEIHRDILFRVYKRSKTQINYHRASHARKVYNTLVKEAKQNYMLGKLKEHEKDQKKYWNDVKMLIPEMTSKKVDEISHPIGGHMCSGKEANDLMNEYFINIGKELADRLPISNFNPDRNTNSGFQLSTFGEFTTANLFKILKETSLTKSSGLDEISTRLLVDAFYSIPEVLVKFYNFSLKKCQIPNCFKTSRVTPLPKKGDTTLMNNLRPISNTPLPSKILEKYVNSVIYEYMESNNLFFKNQNGFRKGKSTIGAVNEVVNHLYEYKNKGEYSMAIFLDLSKAFNCVNHDILCTKLDKLGIIGECKNLIVEYLENRKQFVMNNGIRSECRTINYGIPQGTVLGPLIYLMYVNDIMESDVRSDLSMFADDTAIVAHGNNLKDTISQITDDIDKLSEWFSYNKLTVNLDKSKCMYFGKSVQDELVQVNVKGVRLECVNSFTYLGIIIDNKLQFQDHIKKCIKQAGHKIYMLSRIRHCVNKKTALMIFKSMILPYIEYGNIFHGTCTEFYKQKLQVIQNNGLKIALNRSRLYNTVDLHIEARLLPCKYRRLLMLQKNTFSQLNDNLPPIHINDIPVPTRAHDAIILYVPRPNSELFKKSNCYNGPVLWNTLPVYIRSLKEKNEFKLEINKFYTNLFLADNNY